MIYQGRNKGSSESFSSCRERERGAGREAERGRGREREGRGREGGRWTRGKWRERGGKGKKEERKRQALLLILRFSVWTFDFLCACMCATSFASTVVTHDLEEEQKGKARMESLLEQQGILVCVCVCRHIERGVNRVHRNADIRQCPAYIPRAGAAGVCPHRRAR